MDGDCLYFLLLIVASFPLECRCQFHSDILACLTKLMLDVVMMEDVDDVFQVAAVAALTFQKGAVQNQ